MRRIIATSIMLMLSALLVVAPSAEPSHTMEPTAMGVQDIPAKILTYLAGKFGKNTAKSMVQGQGYTCLSELVCFQEGSYDPPRWGKGTVDVGGSAFYLRVRSWTGINYPQVRTFPHGWKLNIYCQATGEWVYGRWGWTNIWDFIGLESGEVPRFVSDGFVNTGSNGFVAGQCSNTNYGDMAW